MEREATLTQIDYEKYIEGIDYTPGIYAITINNWIVYIGKAKKMRRRVRGHIRNALTGHTREKYRLLFDAINHNQRVKFIVLKKCLANDIDQEEKKILKSYYLPLNTQLSKFSPQPKSLNYKKLMRKIRKCKKWSEELQTIIN